MISPVSTSSWITEGRDKTKRVPDAVQQDAYLELVEDGVPHYNAAHLVGSTARAFSSLRRRNQEFTERYERALRLQPESLQDLVRGSLWARAFGHLFDADVEEDGRAFESQKILAEAVLPELEYKRVKAVRHGQDGPFEVLVGQRVPSDALEQATDEQLEVLEHAYRIIRDLQQGGTLHALPPAPAETA